MDAAEIQRLAEYEEWYWWHRARQAIVTTLLRRHLPEGGASRRVLDVGCGAGATSLVLREFGTVLGVDFGVEAATAARGRGLQSACMDAGHLGVRDESFDVVVALDVLEHLDDDLAAARELRRVLKPGGLLLVTVPAYRWLWSDHDVALGHRRRYRRGEVRGLLARAGLRELLSSYIMTSVLPAAAAVRLTQRLTGRGRPAPEAESGYIPLPAPVNTALTHLVGLDGHLAGRVWLPFGLSVVAVARRVEV
jgi:SAM-dependent methyltransferase